MDRNLCQEIYFLSGSKKQILLIKKARSHADMMNLQAVTTGRIRVGPSPNGLPASRFRNMWEIWDGKRNAFFSPSRIVTFLPVQKSFVPAVPKCDVFREGCDKTRRKLKKIFSCARASYSSQKCDKWDASHFLSAKKVTNVTSLRPLPFNNSWKSEIRVSKSKIEFQALACGKTTANASASCNLPRSSGRSNCKRRSRGAFVEYILFTAEYVLGSWHFKVTSADVRVNISRSTVASPWSVTIDLGREGTPSQHPVLRVEFLLKTESGYLRDAGVNWFTLANP